MYGFYWFLLTPEFPMGNAIPEFPAWKLVVNKLENVNFAMAPNLGLRVFDQLRQITHKQINELATIKLMERKILYDS